MGTLDVAWMQATLPLQLGGLGIRDPPQTRPAARMAALVGLDMNGPDRVGVPEVALSVPAPDLMDTINALRVQLGPNFEPLALWHTAPKQLASASIDHASQRWWAAQVAKEQRSQDATWVLHTTWHACIPKKVPSPTDGCQCSPVEPYAPTLAMWTTESYYDGGSAFHYCHSDGRSRAAQLAENRWTPLGITLYVVTKMVAPDATMPCVMHCLTYWFAIPSLQPRRSPVAIGDDLQTFYWWHGSGAVTWLWISPSLIR